MSLKESACFWLSARRASTSMAPSKRPPGKMGSFWSLALTSLYRSGEALSHLSRSCTMATVIALPTCCVTPQLRSTASL